MFGMFDHLIRYEGDDPSGGDPAGTGSGRDFESEIQALRAEAAKWRTQLRDAQGQLKELSPLAEKAKLLEDAQKTEAQKLAEQMANYQQQLNQLQAEKDAVSKRNQLLTMASKAGVNPDILPLLDVNAFDMSDEAATLEALAKLAPIKGVNGGNVANPSRLPNQNLTDDQLRKEIFGNAGKTSIFGGN